MVTARPYPDMKNPADSAWRATSPRFKRTSRRIHLIPWPAASVAVVIPECAIGVSVAVDNLSPSPFSFHCTVHQINDSRRSGRATSSQMSAAAIASDPIATAPSVTFTVVTLDKTI